ncbi:MAG TPA: GNAT family N-acetyltransferase [Candidatus Eisenbergiella merdavium]|uniref:GNAT family N-acetyltransferase n=1 Tax=Candidatus Eisenbergiella merdavium TaxID=2838551 RepID=A0A9D2NHW6_9FIRM|nr:GNAT family N-acetyltransferase [Candidatus Eisenbergiella merdavium]
MDFQIRKYEEKDFEHLAAIHDPARKKELALASLSGAFLPFRTAAEREGLFDYTVYIAEHAQRIVGFIAFSEEEIAWLYVDVNFSRKGVGRCLMDFALRRLGNDVSIEVLAGNEPALELYRSFGFEIKETVRGHMPGNESFLVTVHVMRRA